MSLKIGDSMYRYKYGEFKKDIKLLAKQVQNANINAMVAISRGGFTAAHFLATLLENRNLFCINSVSYDGQKKLDEINIFNIPALENYKTVLIVDDIVDSGRTMGMILKTLKAKFPNTTFVVASIYYKKTACIKPDFWVKEADEWIEFFWEKF